MHLQAERDKCLCAFVDIPVRGGEVRNIQPIRRMSIRVWGSTGVAIFQKMIQTLSLRRNLPAKSKSEDEQEKSARQG